MEFYELTNLADKQMWMGRFRQGHKGKLKKKAFCYGENSRYIVARENGQDLGFVRINDKSYLYDSYTAVKVWNVTDGYVMPQYRNQLVLMRLIKHVIENYDVKMMFITRDRFIANKNYYFSLGFVHYYFVQNNQMCWAFQDEIWPVVEQRNMGISISQFLKRNPVMIK